MDDEKIKKVVLEIIKSIVPKNMKKTVTLEMELRDELNLDSIKLISLVTILEEKANFDSMLASSEVDFTEIMSGNDLVKVVLEYQK
ncbi:hypothetical protein [Anaeromicropila populeti]|uniref:Carrier domain-containing protein n=1 Tax=Anaeromicropila populeti TaxID=37658 RepID=A0A1I6L0L2_9FIRM|nr:hypothetical protein [Anaeromicropila populeti]SFR96991.1 hypothetical protein SAMN05661086_02956 [Anaeromicropila populeti]